MQKEVEVLIVDLVEEVCPYCDNTGDVHSADGEWRGTCCCKYGVELVSCEL